MPPRFSSKRKVLESSLANSRLGLRRGNLQSLDKGVVSVSYAPRGGEVTQFLSPRFFEEIPHVWASEMVHILPHDRLHHIVHYSGELLERGGLERGPTFFGGLMLFLVQSDSAPDAFSDGEVDLLIEAELRLRPLRSVRGCGEAWLTWA